MTGGRGSAQRKLRGLEGLWRQPQARGRVANVAFTPPTRSRRSSPRVTPAVHVYNRQGGSRPNAIYTRQARLASARAARTSVRELEPRPVLRVVAVEADERLVRGAEQRRGQVRAAELPDQGAAGRRAVLNLQVVVVRLRGEVQKLHVHAYKKACDTDVKGQCRKSVLSRSG